MKKKIIFQHPNTPLTYRFSLSNQILPLKKGEDVFTSEEIIPKEIPQAQSNSLDDLSRNGADEEAPARISEKPSPSWRAYFNRKTIWCFCLFIFVWLGVCLAIQIKFNIFVDPNPPAAVEISKAPIENTKDPYFYANISNMTEAEKELINKPAILQALNDSTPTIHRAFPLYQKYSYSTELRNGADFQSPYGNANSSNNTSNSSNNDSSQNSSVSYYNVEIIIMESNKDIEFCLLINQGNETYNFTEYLNNKTEKDNNNETNSSDYDNETISLNMSNSSQKSEYLQINMIRCNATRKGKVIVCYKPTNMDKRFYMVGVNTLDSFLPILDKSYMEIYEVSTNNKTRLLLKSNDSKLSDEVNGVYGGDYAKKHELLIQTGNDTNSSNMEMHTSYAQNQMGGDVDMATEKQELTVKKISQMNSSTAVPESSQMEGNLNFKAQPNITIDNYTLNPDDSLGDSFNIDFQIYSKENKPPQSVDKEIINLLKNLSQFMEFEEIFNPVENNTYFMDTDSSSGSQLAQSRLLQLSEQGLLFKHNQNLFRKNFIGINFIGEIIAGCYENDECIILGTVNIANILTITLFQKTIKNVKISKVIQKYKVIQWKAYNMIDKITYLLNTTTTSMRKYTDFFIEDTKYLITYFKSSIDQSIEKYSSILKEISKKFLNLGEFTDTSLQVIQNSLVNYYDNFYGDLDSKLFSLDLLIQSFENLVEKSKCQIKNNNTMKAQALEMISYIKNVYKNSTETLINEYNFLFENGVGKQLYKKAYEIINSQLDILSNENVRQLISDFVFDKVQPYLEEFNLKAEKEFINGKVLLIINSIKNEEILNKTLENFEEYLGKIEILDCQEESYDNVDQLLVESSVDTLFDSSTYSIINYKLISEPTETVNVLTETLTNGMSTLILAIKNIITDSQKTFEDIHQFTIHAMDVTKENLEDFWDKSKNKFEVFVENAYHNLKKFSDNIVYQVQNILNSNYEPTEEDLKSMDPNIFNIFNVLDNIFDKLKNMNEIFKSIIKYYKNLFKTNRRLLKEGNKRQLGSLTNTIFDNFFNIIKSKFQEINNAYILSKSSVKNVAESFGVTSELEDIDFNDLEGKLNDIFSSKMNIFDDLIKNQLISPGDLFSLKELPKILDLKQSVIAILKSLLPEKEIAIYSYEENIYNKETTLFTVPIIIGLVNVNAFFSIDVSCNLFFGIDDQGLIYLSVKAGSRVWAGLAVNAEFFIIRLGIYVKVTIFEGILSIILGFDFVRFRFKLKVELDIKALSLALGFYMQLFLPTLKWFCFKIWLFFWTLKICLPYIWFEWTKWIVLYEYSIEFFKYHLVLTDKYLF